MSVRLQPAVALFLLPARGICRFAVRAAGRLVGGGGMIVALTLIAGPVAAQAGAGPGTGGGRPGTGPRESDPAEPGAPAAPGHETEKETIAKCLADLESQDVGRRRRAVLVLGKYSAPLAQTAIIQSLDDPDHVVRRSALVALAEHQILPVPAQKPIFRRLTDPDVHIRRIASSLVREIVSGPMSPLLAMPPQLRGRAGLAAAVDPEIKVWLNRALSDTDATVMKNLLALYAQLPGVFAEPRLRDCLEHQDTEIRVLALRAYAIAYVNQASGADVLGQLAADPDARVRQEVVRAAMRLGAGAAVLLRGFTDDPDAAVRARAVWQLGMVRDPAAPEHIAAMVGDQAVPMAERTRFVRLLRAYPEAAREVLTGLATDGPTPLRAEALRTLGGLRDARFGPDFFLPSLSSPSAEIRRAALAGLGSRAADLAPQVIRGLYSSRFADVRGGALMFLDRLPDEEAVALIMDAILDEDVGVRTAAIHQACLRAVPDWELVLRQSLKDPAAAIRQAAVGALLTRRDMASRRVLADFLKTNTDAELAEFVRNQLVRLNRVPNSGALPGRGQPRLRVGDE